MRPHRPGGVRRGPDGLGGVAGAHVGLGHVPGRGRARQRIRELFGGGAGKIISRDALDDVPQGLVRRKVGQSRRADDAEGLRRVALQ